MNKTKREIENHLMLAIDNACPKIRVVLKRLPKETVPVSIFVWKGHVYIYDLFANKTYSMRHYGKKWALTAKELY